MGNITSAKSKPAATSIIDVTYADLMTLINGSDLIPSAKYRITDYATVHYMLDGNGGVCLDGNSDPYINTGTTEPLIVLAVSANQLDKIAYSATYPQDIIYYDPNPANWLLDLAFGKTDSTLVTGFKGVIYLRHDTKNNNRLGYDFRKVKFRRWKHWTNPIAWSALTNYTRFTGIVKEGEYLYIANKTGINHVVSDGEYWSPFIKISVTEYINPVKNNGTLNDYIDCLTFHSFKATDELREEQYSQQVYNNVFNTPVDSNASWQGYYAYSILSNNVFMLSPTKAWQQVFSNIITGDTQKCTFIEDCIDNNIEGTNDTNVFYSLEECRIKDVQSSYAIGLYSCELFRVQNMMANEVTYSTLKSFTSAISTNCEQMNIIGCGNYTVWINAKRINCNTNQGNFDIYNVTDQTISQYSTTAKRMYINNSDVLVIENIPAR